jgi:amino acid transporter
VLGLLLGAAVEGGVARMVLWYTYTRMDLSSDDMLPPILCHLAIWCVIGALGGLAFGVGIGGRLRWLRAMLGGTFAAALAIVLYDILGAVLLSTHETHLPQAKFPESRALAQILVSMATAIGAIVGARDPKAKKVLPVDSNKPLPE